MRHVRLRAPLRALDVALDGLHATLHARAAVPSWAL